VPDAPQLSRRSLVATALTAPVRPSPAAAYLSGDARLHLLRRATYGPTPASLSELTRLGTTAWLDRQLRPHTIADTLHDRYAAQWGPQDTPVAQVRARQDSGGSAGGEDLFEVPCAHISRAVWSNRQLQAVLEDFWSNHFNVTSPSGGIDATRAHYAATLRRHALGTFSDLLVELTRHPAMLTYLDNRSSTPAAPNENHGRELLELHTVGVGAYGEADVLASTRILTGLSVEDRTDEYRFKPWDHWVGPVQLLGFSHDNATPEGGHDVAEAYLRHLAMHPATARHVVTKLCRHFVSDSPPQSLVRSLTQAWLRNGSAIAPLLRQLFTSREFAASVGHKVRRPYESVAATVRLLGLGPDREGYEGARELVWQSRFSGHGPLEWHAPDGYPDVAAAWASAGGTLARWNTTIDLVAGWWPRTLVHPPLTSLLPRRRPTTHGALVDALALRLFWRKVSGPHRDAACGLLGVTPATPLRPGDAALTWQLPHLVALLLDSPYHGYR
jgi:uncharacterized protein (DUF1800 family)